MSPDDSYKKLGAANLNRTEQYARRIAELLDKSRGRLVNLAAGADYDKGKGDQFYFSDYPDLKKATDSIISSLARGMQQTILAGTSAEWAEGGSDAEGINEYIMEASGIKERVKELGISMKDMTGTLVSGSLNNRSSALKAFQTRRIGGMNLSSRVWDLANQSKIEAELARSIASGTSASDIAKSMQELLNEPAKLFRRVRDEFGTLKLSKNAKAYKAGEGVYSSSYKNALRLARTEINMAYRNAELESYQNMDYVVGFEVKRSTAPYDCPVCEALAGKYPKGFKWNGWHPNCRCFIIPILLTREEMNARTVAHINGDDYDVTKSKNYVSDPPEGFKGWIRDNETRVANARDRQTLPYFFKDNEQLIAKTVLDPDGRMQVGYVEFYGGRKYQKNADGSFTIYGTRAECERQLAQWNELQDQINAVSSEFERQCGDVLEEIPDARFSGLAFKSRGSAVRKADDKFDGDLSRIEDLIRCNFSCSNAQYENVCESLRGALNLYKDQSTAEYMHLTDTGHGYQCRFMNVRLRNGMTGEVMVTPFEQLAGREGERNARRFMGDDVYDRIKSLADKNGIKLGQGHKLYEQARIAVSEGEKKAIFARIDAYYDALSQKCDPFRSQLFTTPVKAEKLSQGTVRNMIDMDGEIITEAIFKRNGEYTAARKRLHERIINEYMEGYSTKSDMVYMLGGAPANGKSTVTGSGMLPHPKGSLVIDADKVKSMIPEYSAMIKSGDATLMRKAANFVHEESSLIGKEIQERAFRKGLSVVIDGVNDGGIEKVQSKVANIKIATGGKRIRADYVSLDTDLSVNLARTRAKKTGRMVPEDVILKNNRAISELVPKLIEQGTFDELYLWDTNMNGQPRLVLSVIDGKLTMYDESLYKRFLGKAKKD